MTVENDKQLNVSFSSWISLLNPGLSSIPLGLGTLVTIAAFLLFNTGTAWNEETPLTCKIPLADSAATYFDFVSPFIRALTTHIDNFPDWQPDTWRFAIYDAKAAVKKITQKSEEEQDQIVEQIWKTISNGAHSINMNKLVEQANLNSIPGAAEKLEYYLGTNELNLEKTKLALKIGAKCVGEIEMRGSFSDILAEHKVCVQEAIDEREVRELEEEGVSSRLETGYCVDDSGGEQGRGANQSGMKEIDCFQQCTDNTKLVACAHKASSDICITYDGAVTRGSGDSGYKCFFPDRPTCATCAAAAIVAITAAGTDKTKACTAGTDNYCTAARQSSCCKDATYKTAIDAAIASAKGMTPSCIVTCGASAKLGAAALHSNMFAILAIGLVTSF